MSNQKVRNLPKMNTKMVSGSTCVTPGPEARPGAATCPYINIPIEGGGIRRVRPLQRVVIPGFEQYTFWATRALEPWLRDTIRITEDSTREYIGDIAHTTIKAAVGQATRTLRRLGLAAFEKARREGVKRRRERVSRKKDQV